MPRPLNIAYITVEDAADKRSWSGSLFFLARALRDQGHRVILIGPLRPEPLSFLCRAFNQITLRLLGKRFNYRDSFILSKAFARIIQRRLNGIQADVVLAPAGLSAIAHLRTPMPIVHFNDRSVAGALEYHAVLKDLFDWSREQSLALERLALRNAALTVYASDWAASAARLSCPEAAHKMVVIPMGANLEEAPSAPPPRDFPQGTINLLFIGVNWENKGGPIAVDALRELGKRGINARLIVCGCDVPADVRDENIVREGFLSKSDPAQRARMDEHLRTADFLILPTRFEAYGIAFCEAAAYGIPALGTRTGGVPTIVLEGETGHLFDLADGGVAYADRIERMIGDPQAWQRMRQAARKRFEEHFTWTAFVTELMRKVQEVGLVSRAR